MSQCQYFGVSRSTHRPLAKKLNAVTERPCLLSSLLLTFDNRVCRALPVLFAWWTMASVTTSLTHMRTCHFEMGLDHKREGGCSYHRYAREGPGFRQGTSRRRDEEPDEPAEYNRSVNNAIEATKNG
jgi:hypothetical protein